MGDKNDALDPVANPSSLLPLPSLARVDLVDTRATAAMALVVLMATVLPAAWDCARSTASVDYIDYEEQIELGTTASTGSTASSSTATATTSPDSSPPALLNLSPSILELPGVFPLLAPSISCRT